jgi:RHS repeat-associated protein
LFFHFAVGVSVRGQSAEFTQGNKGTNAVTLEVPLTSYPGRGINMPVTLRYSSQGLWRIGFINSVYMTPEGYQVQIRRSVTEAIFSDYSTAGWRTSLDVPTVEWPKQNDIYWYTGKPYASGTVYPYTFRISRVFIHMPDGSTHELRKMDAVQQDSGQIDMSGTFYAVDSSRMRYDSTGQTTGTLYLSDGSRYVLSNGDAQFIDRNGNTIVYSSGNRQWTDTMGRTINMPWPANPGYGDYSYSVAGVGGAQRWYTLKFRYLSDVFVADVAGQSQRPISDYYLPNPGSTPTSQGSSNFPQPSGTATLFNSDFSDPDESLQSYTYVVGRGQAGAANFNPIVLAEIDLPNGQSYHFYYNAYGELDKVIYPTGGYQRYQFSTVATIGSNTVPYTQGTRGIVSRWLSPSGNGSDEAQWTYSGGSWPLSITAPNGTRSESYLYNAATSQSNNFGYVDARNGLPAEERTYASSGAMLRRTLIDYEQASGTYSRPSPGTGSYTAYRNPRPIRTTNILLDTGGNALAASTNTAYDASFDFTVGPEPTRTDEFDYASVDQNTAQNYASNYIPYGSPVRITQTSYLTSNQSYRDRNILGLPTSIVVYNGSWSPQSQTTIGYDEYSLAYYGGIGGWNDPGGVRGNATSVNKWVDVSGSWIAAHTQYDQAGNPVNSVDPKGNPSQVTYSSSYVYAYPTQASSAVPDPSGNYGSTSALVATSAYDFSTGLVTSRTDANGQTTSFEYSDPLNRPTRVYLPDGGRTTKIYVDSHPCGGYVQTLTLLDSSGREGIGYTFFDGLGRAARTFTYENQDTGNPYLTSDTQYDSMGRAWRVSSPYRSAGCGAAVNPSGRWTQTTFDALGRSASVLTTVDNATATTSYSGNTVTVTDPAGKSRRSVSDALGRLTTVYEDPYGANYWTSYTYDALGRLRGVNQNGQQRFFMYDSLSRLIRARYPEQDANGNLNTSDPVTGNSYWTAAYSYDNNGNVTTRTDARNVTTTYGYDALNRDTTESYSDGTAPVYRYYDFSSNGRGRLYWQQSAGVAAGTIDAYDAVGRVTQYKQRFWVNGTWATPYTVTRNYDYAGDVLSQTYPSGHTVNYSYDIASRMSNFSGSLGDGVSRTYSTNLSFSEFGGVQQEQFGTQTPVYDKRHYNSRGQMYDQRLSSYSWGASEWDWNRGATINYFSSNYSWGGNSSGSGPDNNGNIWAQVNYAPANEWYGIYSVEADYYGYDSLNRLTYDYGNSYSTNSGTWTGDYCQYYSYDQWGNRTVNPASYGSVPKPVYTTDSNTNRLIAPSGYWYGYDANGNQTYDNYTGEGARNYDAENHMTSAWANNQWQYYTYDFGGHRIKRIVNGTETWQVYGIGGELLGEYKVGAPAFMPSKEYGYRAGELLVTMASGDDNRLSRFVTNLYRGALQRDPNSTELQNGVNTLGTAGATGGYSSLLSEATNLAVSLLASTNYGYNTGRSDTQFVADLYYTYLQRGPDDGGLGWWAGQVPSNGRYNVLLAFQYSGEFQALVATLYGSATSDNQRAEHIVNNFYLGALGRDATSGELTSERDALNNAAAQGVAPAQGELENFARSIFASQINDYSISDQQFVTNLYEGFLQRGPDAGGLGFWSSIAANGNRQNVLNAFAGATEFHELAATLYRECFWLVHDRLGSPRMIVDKSGSLSGVRRHDYLPFGEELYTGVGQMRTLALGFTGDSTRQKFTGYEDDAETGLNYAEARYQSPMQGRFTSVDPLGASASAANPQSLNRYSYVENDPVNSVDPDGLMTFMIDGMECSAQTAGLFLHSGAGVPGPLSTVRYDYQMNTFVWFTAVAVAGGTGKAWIPNGFHYIGDFTWGYTDYGPAKDGGDPRSFSASFKFEDPHMWYWENGQLVTMRWGVIWSAYGDHVRYLTEAVHTDWAAQMAIGSGLNAARLGLGSLIDGLAGAAADGAATDLSALTVKQLTEMIRGTQKDLLGKLFGRGLQGAETALESGEVPEGITRQTLVVYRELAQRAIANGMDKGGVQAVRLKVIEAALKKVN